MKRLRWLIAGLFLLLLGAWLMSLFDEQPRLEARSVDFPRTPRARDWERRRARQQLAPLPAEASAPADATAPAEVQRRDPLLVALPAASQGAAFVLEANALVHSPAGQLLLNCLRGAEREDPLALLREKTGIDLLRDLDRVATSGSVLLATGQFGDVPWDSLPELQNGSSRYGDSATFYRLEARSANPEERDPRLAVWRNQMVLFADGEEELRAAVDRLEGRARPESPIPESEAYGDLYGFVGREALASLVGQSADPAVQKLIRLAEKVEVHVDAGSDVALVAKVAGGDSAGLEDLGRTLGAALSVARVEAQMKGEKDFAELLDFARVLRRGSGEFTLELAMPLAFIERQLKGCRALRKPPPDAP